MKPSMSIPLLIALLAINPARADDDEPFYGPNHGCKATAIDDLWPPESVSKFREDTVSAAARNNWEEIGNLMWANADPEWVRGTRWYQAALWESLHRGLIGGAAAGNNAKVLAALDKGADVNVNAARNRYMSPLIWAAGCNHTGTVDLLLRRGANVNGTATWDIGTESAVEGETPLMFAARYAQHETVRLLLSRGANPNAQATLIPDAHWPRRLKGTTPLLSAGSTKTIEILLDAKADPNIQQWDGITPLMIAASEGSEAIVKMLLAHGALPALRNTEGQTAADLARQHNHPAVADLIDAWNGGPARSR